MKTEIINFFTPMHSKLKLRTHGIDTFNNILFVS